MMSTQYVASYDFGTSGVKASLIDFNGNVCCTSNAEYALISPHPGWAEQEPESYWTACCNATKKAMYKLGAKPDQVKGIAFGTHWRGVIPLDRDNRVLYNNIIWLDKRASEQAAALNQMLGTRMTYIDYWPRLMWIKENMPELYQNTESFLDLNAFLKFKATGEKAIDATNHYFSATSVKLQEYYNRIVAAAGLEDHKIPPLVLPTEKVGELTAKAAEELGLAKGTPVFGGCGDIPAVAIGAGCSTVGSCHMYLGSSGWLGTIMPERGEGIGELHCSFDKDKEIMLYAMPSACMSVNWAINQFYKLEKEAAGEEIFALIDRDLEEVEAGSGNMVAIPWIHGELRSEHAKAAFFNITNEHDSRHFISAIMEGVCYTLRWKADLYRRETGNVIPSIRVVGGGACSEPWMRRLSNILQIPVQIPNSPRHAGAIGTAYCALIGLGICESFEEADRRIHVAQTFLPDPELAPLYNKLYDNFKALIPALDGMYVSLNSHS